MKDVKIFAFADEASKFIDEQIVALKRNGLNGLEIRGVDGENISDITIKKAKEVRAKLDANGLSVWSMGSPIGKIDIDGDFEAHKQKFMHTLELANVLGAKNLRMFSFFMPKDQNPEQYFNQVVDKLGVLLDIASGTEIELCHENEKGIYGDTADRCKKLLTALPKLKAVFDPANFVQCGENTLEAWKLLKEYTYYMHIKDALANGKIVPAGAGEGNVKQIASEFISLHKNPVFTMEPHLTAFVGLKNLEREGEESESAFSFTDADAAFDAACDAFKKLI